MNNDLLRYLLVALVLVAGVVALALCADGPCSAEAHVCFSVADHSRPPWRVARRLGKVRSSAVSLAFPVPALTSRGFRSALAEFVPALDLLKVSSLRI